MVCSSCVIGAFFGKHWVVDRPATLLVALADLVKWLTHRDAVHGHRGVARFDFRSSAPDQDVELLRSFPKENGPMRFPSQPVMDPSQN